MWKSGELVERNSATAFNSGRSFPLGHAGHGRFRVQQPRHLPAQFRRREQPGFRHGQGDARPVLPHSVRILGEIGRRVADGQCVEPDQRGHVGVSVGILDSEPGEISSGGRREI